MTHCNAGWLATCGHGTALAPVYAAREAGIPVEVWVSETRPRNQGLLTAWGARRLGGAPPSSPITPPASCWPAASRPGRHRGRPGGANGDSANKIGTYLGHSPRATMRCPSTSSSPSSTIDFGCPDGSAIPIEDRDGEELRR